MRYPKTGIRPVIDGRWGGVRESLEGRTMAIARSAAALISGTWTGQQGGLFPTRKEGPDQCVS